MIDIIWKLIDKPHTPKPYRMLRDLYIEKGMKDEAESLDWLLKKKYADNSNIDRLPN